MQNVPALKEDVQHIYSDGSYLRVNPGWHMQDSAWKAGEIRRMFVRNSIVPSNVAEVGCGAGEILSVLSNYFPAASFSGYEISRDAYDLCMPRQTDRVRFFLKDVADQGQRFDVLLCIDVFEHVENYMGFLRGLKKHADLVVFHIPLDIYVLSLLRQTMLATRKYVGHLHYFTPQTALETLRDCGYEIIDSFFTNSFDGAPTNSIEARLMRLPRRLGHSIAPGMSQLLIGGCSLMVLGRPRHANLNEPA